MHLSPDDDGFREAERRAEQGMYKDYRETGEALRQIRDEAQDQWRPIYGTWTSYLDARLGICRQTASYMIRAAEVAEDLSSRDDALRLPVRHANLLARFEDPDVRLKLALEIRHLTFKEAARLVIDFSAELQNTTTPRPAKAGRSDKRNEALAQFDAILRSCASLEPATLARAASGLGDERRLRLARRATRAGHALIKVSEALTKRP